LQLLPVILSANQMKNALSWRVLQSSRRYGVNIGVEDLHYGAREVEVEVGAFPGCSYRFHWPCKVITVGYMGNLPSQQEQLHVNSESHIIADLRY